MKRRIRIFLWISLLISSCHDGQNGSLPAFFSCNDLLNSCSNVAYVPYCTFGFKWGNGNPFAPNGPGISGPHSGINSLSYKFLNGNVAFKSSFQDQGLSMQFTEDDKSKIRDAILQWSSVANVNFDERGSNEKADITIISAFLPISTASGGSTCGLGYPVLDGPPCNQLAGMLIINPKCNQTQAIALHEMGHVLGLGHVASENVMNPDRLNVFSTLQSGDVLGIQSIYGIK